MKDMISNFKRVLLLKIYVTKKIILNSPGKSKFRTLEYANFYFQCISYKICKQKNPLLRTFSRLSALWQKRDPLKALK